MEAEERAHRAAVRSALAGNDEIGRLVGRLGTAEHPRGAVLVAYRNARRSLRGALSGEPGSGQAEFAVREIMAGLQQDVTSAMRTVAAEAVAAGTEMAREQLAGYGERESGGAGAWGSGGLWQEQQGAVAAVAAVVAQQGTAALGLALQGTNAGMIAGNGQQAGIVQPGPALSTGALWIGTLQLGAFWWWIEQRSRGQAWWHQAVAAIDERTTDCCLRVNGQAQPLEQPFRLTGTPRYADRLPHPPFHWYCRTAEAIVRREQATDAVSEEMRSAAWAELRARERTGRREEIHPAHSRSRRGRGTG